VTGDGKGEADATAGAASTAPAASALNTTGARHRDARIHVAPSGRVFPPTPPTRFSGRDGHSEFSLFLQYREIQNRSRTP
jgi:hypothetical protein